MPLTGMNIIELKSIERKKIKAKEHDSICIKSFIANSVLLLAKSNAMGIVVIAFNTKNSPENFIMDGSGTSLYSRGAIE